MYSVISPDKTLIENSGWKPVARYVGLFGKRICRSGPVTAPCVAGQVMPVLAWLWQLPQ